MQTSRWTIESIFSVVRQQCILRVRDICREVDESTEVDENVRNEKTLRVVDPTDNTWSNRMNFQVVWGRGGQPSLGAQQEFSGMGWAVHSQGLLWELLPCSLPRSRQRRL